MVLKNKRKKTVRAWANIHKEKGIFFVACGSYEALKARSDYDTDVIVPCTISFELPNKSI